jgi:cytochrome c
MFPDLDCNTCHRVEEKLVGPSFRDIAKKYPMTNANVSLLADRIIKGSSGVWGETPMSAHEAIKADAAKAIAKKILDLESE